MQRAALTAGAKSLHHVRPRIAYQQAPISRRHASKSGPLSWISDKFKKRFLEQRERPGDSNSNAAVEAKKEAAKRQELSVFDAAVPSKEADGEGKDIVAAVEDQETTKRWKKNGYPREMVKRDSHKYSTTTFKISHRKLNDLGRQIAGKPIDHAILQMQFSEKRASERIKHMLVTARDHAHRYKAMDASKLVVAESWVSKGPHKAKRIEPKGRGRTGVQTHPNAKLSVVLKEGLTLEEQRAKDKAKRLKKIVSASLVREDKPIRNPGANWAW